jgi:hypothetical protein
VFSESFHNIIYRRFEQKTTKTQMAPMAVLEIPQAAETPFHS